MTIKELIEKLSKLDPSLELYCGNALDSDLFFPRLVKAEYDSNLDAVKLTFDEGY